MSHTKKILSQAGISLADQYDVAGSVAGLETLDSEEVKTVHEMGGTIFSERLSSTISRIDSAANAQNITFNIETANANRPDVTRLLGLTVFSPLNRFVRLQVSIFDPVNSRDMVIWAWDSNEEVLNITMDIGAGPASGIYYVSTLPFVPTLIFGTNQPDNTPDLSIRGITSSFGAGTEILTVLLHFAFPRLGGVSSYGLPIPSW